MLFFLMPRRYRQGSSGCPLAPRAARIAAPNRSLESSPARKQAIISSSPLSRRTPMALDEAPLAELPESGQAGPQPV